MKLTAIIEAEGDGYVSACPELDIASQGDSIEQARDNLREALELFFECASAEEVKQREVGQGDRSRLSGWKARFLGRWKKQ